MPNEYVNHVIINNETKVDLRGDTVDPEHLVSGYIAHDRSGAQIVGTMETYPDGDLLGYGHVSNNLVGAAYADSAVVSDPDSDIAGYALTDMATLVE